jgi:hypothetical protein
MDVLCATKLLLDLESKRLHKKKEMAWKWEKVLTSHGIKFQEDCIANINFCDYSIDITDSEDCFKCRVSRGDPCERRCYFLKEPNLGSLLGGCSCGAPYNNGIPCHYMDVVIKCERIDGLTQTKTMPNWWMKEM